MFNCTKLFESPAPQRPDCSPLLRGRSALSYISEPRLKTMTYEGNVCSLDEAFVLNTLKCTKRNKANIEDNSDKRNSNNKPKKLNSSQSSFTHNSYFESGRNHINCTLPRNTTHRTSLSPNDISAPKLQMTTYNESLADLITMQNQLKQINTNGKIKANNRTKTQRT